MARAYNFSAGPAILPVEVLEEAQKDLVDYQGSGMSIMEMSHRGKEYSAVHDEAIANMRELLGISDDYAVLFLTGGASGQFAWIPMNLLGEGQVADYTATGSWASKAIKEAKILGKVNIAADSSKESPARMPLADECTWTDGAAYAHITTNETIGGIQWKAFPDAGSPLVADMSSDILSRPFDVSKFGLIYAGAQKNIGPAGVTVVLIKDDFLQKRNEGVATMLDYKTHADKLYNTPPVFAVYMVEKVLRWLEGRGGIDGIQKINERKAKMLYDRIDKTDFYRGAAVPDSRSVMNVCFRLPSEELEGQFVKAAAAAGLQALKGHRSVGGIRASIYNACPTAAVEALTSFMDEFEQKNG